MIKRPGAVGSKREVSDHKGIFDQDKRIPFAPSEVPKKTGNRPKKTIWDDKKTIKTL
jgi:hypothetical protein